MKVALGPNTSVYFLHLIKIGITSNLYSVIFVSRKPLQGDSSLPTSKASRAFSPLEYPPQATLAYLLNSSHMMCASVEAVASVELHTLMRSRRKGLESPTIKKQEKEEDREQEMTF